ncbi:MAG: hypothetical protein ACRC1P_09615 [Cellulosilyticaceae bacterium]
MNGRDLKTYLVDSDRVVDLLDVLGMHSIKSYGGYIQCGLPDSSNSQGVTVRIPSLYIKSYARDMSSKFGATDIFDLVEYCTGKSGIPYVLNFLGISSIDAQSTRVNDGLDLFRKAKRNKKSQRQSKVYLEENILNKYEKFTHMDMVSDGLFPSTCEEFEVGYDLVSERITFPHRDWQSGRILAIIGRTTIKAFKELNIAKYFTIAGIGYAKTNNLYGLCKNREEIAKQRKIILVEAEKSVMKLWQGGIRYAVSLGCHEVSKIQIAILMMLGLDEITVSFDADVPMEHINKVCRELKGAAKVVSYIYVGDIKIYQPKESPADKGIKRFNVLYKMRKVWEEEVDG